jgi:hypothetical protein
MGTLILACTSVGSNITLSDSFEKLCTRPMTEKTHGTFFSVVRRKIGDHDVIMAGEIDCSSSKHLD